MRSILVNFMRRPLQGAALGFIALIFGCPAKYALKLVANAHGKLGVIGVIHRLTHGSLQLHVHVKLIIQSVRQIIARSSIGKLIVIFAAFGSVIAF